MKLEYKGHGKKNNKHYRPSSTVYWAVLCLLVPQPSHQFCKVSVRITGVAFRRDGGRIPVPWNTFLRSPHAPGLGGSVTVPSRWSHCVSFRGERRKAQSWMRAQSILPKQYRCTGAEIFWQPPPRPPPPSRAPLALPFPTLCVWFPNKEIIVTCDKFLTLGLLLEVLLWPLRGWWSPYRF